MGLIVKKPPTPPIPLEAFFASESGRGLAPNSKMLPTLHAAEVIFGVDVMTNHMFILYGRQTVKRIFESKRDGECVVLCIALDRGTDELEKAVAMIEIAKGSHDYRN